MTSTIITGSTIRTPSETPTNVVNNSYYKYRYNNNNNNNGVVSHYSFVKQPDNHSTTLPCHSQMPPAQFLLQQQQLFNNTPFTQSSINSNSVSDCYRLRNKIYTQNATTPPYFAPTITHNKNMIPYHTNNNVIIGTSWESTAAAFPITPVANIRNHSNPECLGTLPESQNPHIQQMDSVQFVYSPVNSHGTKIVSDNEKCYQRQCYPIYLQRPINVMTNASDENILQNTTIKPSSLSSIQGNSNLPLLANTYKSNAGVPVSFLTTPTGGINNNTVPVALLTPPAGGTNNNNAPSTIPNISQTFLSIIKDNEGSLNDPNNSFMIKHILFPSSQGKASPSSLVTRKYREQNKSNIATEVMSLKRKTKITKSQKKNNKYMKEKEQQGDQTVQIWNCKVCDKCFVRYSWLKRHELSHASDKKFHCVYCNSKHKRKDNLLQHLRIKHPSELLSEIENQMVLEKYSSMEILNFKAASKSLLTVASSNTNIDTNSPLVNNKENVIRILVDNGLLKKDFLRKVSNALILQKEQSINH